MNTFYDEKVVFFSIHRTLGRFPALRFPAFWFFVPYLLSVRGL